MKNTSVFLKFNQELYCNTLHQIPVIVGGNSIQVQNEKYMLYATK